MNNGPLIFLAAFFALSTSWFGFVLMPQLQIGGQTPDKTDNLTKAATRTNWLALQRGLPVKEEGSGPLYPSARPGLAKQGEEIYRANGCFYCHSQQVRQTGTAFDVFLVNAGTNQTEVLSAVRKVNAGLTEADAKKMLEQIPQAILWGVTNKAVADAAQRALEVGGAQAEVRIVPIGPDIARGWGRRGTVAQDYLFGRPVMLGAQRIGPDLANVGRRLPDADWQLRHLYNPRGEVKVKNSTMPPYRFLFEKRKIVWHASPDALKFAGESASPRGYEIVPKAEARALVAYLQSLQADAPLFEAPMTVPPPPPAPEGATNALPTGAMTATNLPPTNPPLK